MSGFMRMRLFGSETERVIGRAHEFTLYKRTTTELEGYFKSTKPTYDAYTGLFGFIQPRFFMDERYEIKGISDRGSLIAHFKQTYHTSYGQIAVDVRDEILWQDERWVVLNVTPNVDGLDKGLVRASLEKKHQ
jgi:hypothetical protein